MQQSITWGDKILLSQNVWNLAQTDLKNHWSSQTASFLVSKLTTNSSLDIENATWIIKQLVEMPDSPCIQLLSENIVQGIKSGLTHDNDQTRDWSFDIIKHMLDRVPNMAYDILRTNCISNMLHCADSFVINELWDELQTALQVFELINTNPCVHYRKQEMKTQVIQLCEEALNKLIPCVSVWPQEWMADCVQKIADMLSNIILMEDTYDAGGILLIERSMLQLIRLSDIWDEDLWSTIKLTLDRRLTLLPTAAVRECMVSLFFSYRISENYKLKNEVLNIVINFCQSLPLGSDINDYIPRIAVKWLSVSPENIWNEKYNHQSPNTLKERTQCLVKCCQTLYEFCTHGIGVTGVAIQFGLQCVQQCANMQLTEAGVLVIKANWMRMTSFQQQKCLKAEIFASVAQLCNKQNEPIIDDLLYTFMFGDNG